MQWYWVLILSVVGMAFPLVVSYLIGRQHGARAERTAQAKAAVAFTRRPPAIEPERDGQRVTRGPSPAFDRQRASRVSTAHISQVRADWSADEN